MSFSRKEVLKNFSVGFLPVVIFLIAEIYFGVVTGIMVALIFGLAEFIFLYIKFGYIYDISFLFLEIFLNK